jgi:hypothetical protein
MSTDGDESPPETPDTLDPALGIATEAPAGATDEPPPRRPWTSLSPGEWARLLGRQFGVVGDTFLAVVGAALVALGVAVVLDAFDVVEIGFPGTTGAQLGSGLVIGVLGLFALGVASEGPMTGPVIDWPDVELAIARVAAVLAVSGLGLIATRFVAAPAADLGYPFELGVAALSSASLAGFFVALPLGVGGGWLMRVLLGTPPGWDRVVLLGAWTVGTWAFVLASLP